MHNKEIFGRHNRLHNKLPYLTIIENAKCAIFADSSYMGMVVTYNKIWNVYTTLAEVLKVNLFMPFDVDM